MAADAGSVEGQRLRFHTKFTSTRRPMLADQSQETEDLLDSNRLDLNPLAHPALRFLKNDPNLSVL